MLDRRSEGDAAHEGSRLIGSSVYTAAPQHLHPFEIGSASTTTPDAVDDGKDFTEIGRWGMLALAALGFCFVLFWHSSSENKVLAAPAVVAEVDGLQLQWKSSALHSSDSSGGLRILQALDSRSSAELPLAWGTYEESVGGNGWNYLKVQVADRTLLPELPSQHQDIETTALRLLSAREPYLRGMYAMGLIEGFQTCEQISQWYRNFYDGMFAGDSGRQHPSEETLDFIFKNYEWQLKQSELYGALPSERAASAAADEKDIERIHYWMTVAGVLRQLHGVFEGARLGCPHMGAAAGEAGRNSPLRPETRRTDDDTAGSYETDDGTGEYFWRGEVYMPDMETTGLDMIHLLLMNANGDLFQITEKFKHQLATKLSTAVNSNISSSNEMQEENFGSDHCSALIKLLPDGSDVLFGHSTWDDYQCASPRIFKHYHYPSMSFLGDGFMQLEQKGFETLFSSSPGLMSSVDDFYSVIHHHGPPAYGTQSFTVMETSMELFNTTLLQLIHSETAFSWMRARASNQLARSGAEWAHIFSQHASGTYANEWMVLDYSKYNADGHAQHPEAKQKQIKLAEEGFLTVLEELPGHIHWEDMTAMLLEQGYWASYNNPYFTDIAKISGNYGKCNTGDYTACYNSKPRGRIFAALHDEILNLDDMQRVMQYNRYQTDPLQQNDSCHAVACRRDLEEDANQRQPYGAVDSKVSAASLTVPEWPSAVGKPFQPQIHIRMGPTHDDQTPFCWSAYQTEVEALLMEDTLSSSANLRGQSRRSGSSIDQSADGIPGVERRYAHIGHPDCFTYDWQLLPPPVAFAPLPPFHN